MKRRVTAMLIAAAALGLGACDAEENPKHAETEGVQVLAGGLKYQVQISRLVNPDDVEDRAFLTGFVDPQEAKLEAGQEWFAVFVRVKNFAKKGAPRPATDKFVIEDTTGAEFEPVQLDSRVNPLAYSPRQLGPEELIPAPNSIASTTTTQGSLLLFKMPRQSLENRPLELKITALTDEAAVNLDV